MTEEKKEKQTGGDVADFLQAPALQRRFHVRLVGTSPLKPDRMSEEEIVDALIRGIRNQPNREAALADMAKESLYRDAAGKIGIPADNVLASFRGAGTSIPWGAKSSKQRITNSKGKTMLFAFLKIEQSFLRLIDVPKGGVNDEGWEVDIKLGKMPNGTAVGIVRPRYDTWAIEFDMTITYMDVAVTNAMVGKLISMAGMSQGLCAHRPNHGGRFGCFRLDSIEEISLAGQKMKAAAA